MHRYNAIHDIQVSMPSEEESEAPSLTEFTEDNFLAFLLNDPYNVL